MATSTWRSSQGSSQPPPGGSPSPSTRRFNSSKTTPLVSSMVSSSSASTLFHSALTWLSRFSSDRSISPNCHGVAEKPGKDTKLQQAQKRICMCEPSSYPGLRCILHRKSSSGSSSSSSRTAFGHNNDIKRSSSSTHAIQTPTATSNADRLTIRRFAMINSQARSGTVEEDFVKRALTSLTLSSSQKQCRRKDFHRQRSRLSVMSKAEDN